jgi:hypothetical protein
MRSPKEPGQMNHPPPLEYPATRHPERPSVAMDTANSAPKHVRSDSLVRFLCRFRFKLLHSAISYATPRF